MPPKRGAKGSAAAAAAPSAATPTAASSAAAQAMGPVLTWTGEVHAVNSVPGRCSAVAVLAEHSLLVFGGWVGGATNEHVQTVHQLDVGTAVWSEVDVSGDAHPGTSQSAAADVGGAILFFGGWTGSKRTNDTTLFQLDSRLWSPFATVGERPPALTNHTCSVVGKRMYVYGGNGVEGQSADVHILDLTSTAWGTAATLGAPPKRSSHTATVINDQLIVVFGGRGEAGALNDVAVFDCLSTHWNINAKLVDGSAVPPPRHGHTASAVGSNILVFGGTSESGAPLNDLWVLRAERVGAMMWQKVQTEGPPPSVRTNHCAVETLSAVYILAGRTSAHGEVSSQVWALDTGALAPLPSTERDADSEADPAAASKSLGPSATPGTETTGY